jgi:hypothetical protein
LQTHNYAYLINCFCHFDIHTERVRRRKSSHPFFWPGSLFRTGSPTSNNKTRRNASIFHLVGPAGRLILARHPFATASYYYTHRACEAKYIYRERKGSLCHNDKGIPKTTNNFNYTQQEMGGWMDGKACTRKKRGPGKNGKISHISELRAGCRATTTERTHSFREKQNRRQKKTRKTYFINIRHRPRINLPRIYIYSEAENSEI